MNSGGGEAVTEWSCMDNDMSSPSVFILKAFDIHIVGRLGSMGILSWKSWA